MKEYYVIKIKKEKKKSYCGTLTLKAPMNIQQSTMRRWRRVVIHPLIYNLW